MAITLVQSANANGVSTLSFSGTPAQGNLLVCCLGVTKGGLVTMPTVSSAGWTLAVEKIGTDCGAGVWYKVAGASESKQVDANNMQGAYSISIMEYSGTDLSPFDKSASNSADDVESVASGTTATTSVADELLVVQGRLNAVATQGSMSWNNSFTELFNHNSRGSIATRIVSSTGTFSSTLSWSTLRKSAALIVTFKQAQTAQTVTPGVAVGSGVVPSSSVGTGQDATVAVPAVMGLGDVRRPVAQNPEIGRVHVRLFSDEGTHRLVELGEAIGSGVVPAPSVDVTTFVPGSAYSTLGVVRRNGSIINDVANFESSAGINRPMPGPIGFTVGKTQSTWTAWRNRWAGALEEVKSRCAGASARNRVVIGLSIWPAGDTSIDLAYVAAKTGADWTHTEFDAEWDWLVSTAKSKGYTASNIIFRPMWEHNIQGFRWSTHASGPNANPDQATARANYITAWRRFHARITRAGNFPGAVFDYNCLANNSGAPAAHEAAYPGDAYVDYIGADFYDNNGSFYPPGPGETWDGQRNAMWTQYARPMLDNLATFASARGKLLSFPEIGTLNDAATQNGGDDNPIFVDNFINWLNSKGSQLGYWVYFEQDAGGEGKFHQLHNYPGNPRAFPFVNAQARFDQHMRKP